MMESSIEDLIKRLPEFFVPENAKDVNITAQLNLEGDLTDYWTLQIADMHCETHHTKSVNPQLILKATAVDLLAILAGTLDITRAYMQGKIKLEGKIMLALKLMDLFEIPDEFQSRIRY